MGANLSSTPTRNAKRQKTTSPRFSFEKSKELTAFWHFTDYRRQTNYGNGKFLSTGFLDFFQAGPRPDFPRKWGGPRNPARGFDPVNTGSIPSSSALLEMRAWMPASQLWLRANQIRYFFDFILPGFKLAHPIFAVRTRANPVFPWNDKNC
jgi:hypothetical protein